MQYRHAIAGAAVLGLEHGFSTGVRVLGDVLTDVAGKNGHLIPLAIAFGGGVVIAVAVGHAGHHVAEWLEQLHHTETDE